MRRLVYHSVCYVEELRGPPCEVASLPLWWGHMEETGGIPTVRCLAYHLGWGLVEISEKTCV